MPPGTAERKPSSLTSAVVSAADAAAAVARGGATNQFGGFSDIPGDVVLRIAGLELRILHGPVIGTGDAIRPGLCILADICRRLAIVAIAQGRGTPGSGLRQLLPGEREITRLRIADCERGSSAVAEHTAGARAVTQRGDKERARSGTTGAGGGAGVQTTGSSSGIP